VQGVLEEIVQCGDQLFRQLFVEEQAHDSGGRNTLCTALALRRIGQARTDVFSGQLREVCDDFVFRDHGAVDAVQAGVTVFVPFKYYDVAKYHTNTNHYLVTGFGTVSKRWYDGLPADLQRAVVEEAMAEQASLHEWTKNLYTEGVRVWKERTKDGWIELTEEQRAAFRQRLEGVDGKVAAQIPLLKEWLDLLRAKSKQYAR